MGWHWEAWNWALGPDAPEGGLRLRQAQDKIGHWAWDSFEFLAQFSMKLQQIMALPKLLW